MRINAVFFCIALVSGVAQAGPAIQHWQTANGARVYFVPALELPMVDVQVTFDAGSARDGAKHGVAVLTSALLDDGAAELNADQIAARLEGVGAQMGAGAEQDTASLSLRSVTDAAQFEPAVATTALVLTQPGFPQEAFERERNRLLVAVRNRKQSPGEISQELFLQTLYGTHPYGHLPNGSEETLQKLTRDDVLAHYRQYYVGRNAVVAIVGALDRPGAERLAEQLVGKLPAGTPAPALPAVAALAKAQTVKQAHPSTQTHIVMGQPGISRDDPDYFALYVGNHVLGGSGLVSRLSEQIREQRGLSYSVYSYFMPMRRPGPYELALQTRNESANEALKVLSETLEKFIQEGPTDKELTAAKQNITGGFPLRLASNKKIVDYIAMIGFHKLPLDYLDTFTSKVEAVTAQQIRAAFQRRVHPGKMVTVVVGNNK